MNKKALKTIATTTFLGTILSGSTGNSVKGNTVQSNNATDLVDDNSACDNNTWRDNVFNTANQTCIQ
jgi:hypothetical protein